MRRLSYTVFLLLFGLATRVHAAPDEDAKRLYDQGLRDLKTQHFADAALAFEAAFRVQPHPASLFMAAGAWEEAGSLARAADAWSHCLTEQGLSSAQKEKASARLSSIETQVGTVVVSAAGTAGAWEARLGEGSFFALPARLHAAPGPQRLQVRDGAGKIHPELGHSLQLGSGNVQTLALELSVEPKATVTIEKQSMDQSTGDESHTRTQRTRVIAAVGLVTLGAGCLVGSAVMWRRANATHDEFEQTPTWALHDKGVSQVRWTNALGAGGIALLLSGVAVALWPTSPVQPAVFAHSLGVAGVSCDREKHLNKGGRPWRHRSAIGSYHASPTTRSPAAMSVGLAHGPQARLSAVVAGRPTPSKALINADQGDQTSGGPRFRWKLCDVPAECTTRGSGPGRRGERRATHRSFALDS